jgi:glycosyltransferase involved in cell wall biosynthesis
MTDSLRFCLVTTFYPPYHFGGDAVFVYQLAEALAALGHSIDVIHSEDAYRLRHRRDPEIEWPHHPAVRRHSLKSQHPVLASLASHQLGQPAAYRPKLRQLLEDGRYDVIHYHNISLMGGPGILRFGTALKLYTTHEYWLVCPTHVLFAFNREACTVRHCLRCTLHTRRPPQLWRSTGLLDRCAREVDLFLTPSHFSLERHRADGFDHPMTVLPHFVVVPGDDKRPGRHDDEQLEPYFLFVGRLEKLKGAQDLIDIFKNYDKASLWIVGDGDDAPALQERAKGLSHVRFFGSLPAWKLPELYRQSIALIVPSLCYETFSLSAAEALANGTPVISRDIGAVGELVGNSGGGLTFQSLVECEIAMERLRRDPKLRSALAARGRKAALENWTVQRHIERYLALIRERLPNQGVRR